MITFTGVNWLAVFVGTIVSMVMGMLWYGPLFGDLWLRLIGKTAEEIEGDPMVYIKTTVAAFISMLFLNLVVLNFGAGSLLAGVLIGMLTFIALGATMTFVYTAFEGPDEKIWLLYVGYQLVVFVIMGGVFAVWR